MPTGNLPEAGKKIFEEVYDKALKGSCSGDEKCAAQTAWKAVKNAGWKKVDDKWVKQAELTEFHFRIDRASYDKVTQERRWRGVASDTLDDLHRDNMSTQLFADFLNRIESGELVPPDFRSDYWSGGTPYLSISHYDDLGGKGVPGIVDAIYVDGNTLKAKGRFHNTPLGIRCFDAICNDLYNKNSTVSEKIRISIGFLDWSHKHKRSGYVFVRESIEDICPECLKELMGLSKSEGKIYLKGHLIHLALTRVPVNERTIMEVDKSMAITRKEDAASIIGEELANELDDEQKKVAKSMAMVTHSDTEDETQPETGEPEVVVTEANQNKDEKENEEEAENGMSDTEEDEREEAEKVKEKDSKKEKSAISEKSYGGATSLAEAKKIQEAKKEYGRLADLWYMFSEVMYNIFASSEIENKGDAIKKVVDEFKSMVENKSLSILSLIEESLHTNSMASNANSDVHPLDDVMSDLRKDFSEAVALDATPTEKLQLIQDSYSRLGLAIKETIEKSVPETQEVSQSTQADNSQIVELANVVASLSQKFDLLMAKMSQPQELTGPKVPERRSIQPQPFLPFANTVQQTKPMSIREAVYKSVGLSE